MLKTSCPSTFLGMKVKSSQWPCPIWPHCFFDLIYHSAPSSSMLLMWFFLVLLKRFRLIPTPGPLQLLLQCGTFCPVSLWLPPSLPWGLLSPSSFDLPQPPCLAVLPCLAPFSLPILYHLLTCYQFYSFAVHLLQLKGKFMKVGIFTVLTHGCILTSHSTSET